MASVASLLVSMKADFGNTNSQVDDLTKALVSLKESVEDMSGKLKPAEDQVHETGDKVDELREKAQDLSKELLKLGLEVLGVASVFEVLKESMEVSAEIESVTVALTAFTGSAEQAKDVIESMEVLSKSEALKFPEVLPAAQHFMALGFSTEQVKKVMEAAGNASWALGTSVESVTQRVGMMAMGGQVSGRYLRSLGINLEDLAHVMGVTGSSAVDLEQKVREAFKGMEMSDRIDALTDAMQKFGGVGAKEAETMSGKWIEMKNAFHEAFANIGDDLAPLANVLLGIAKSVADVIAGLAKLSAMHQVAVDSKLPPPIEAALSFMKGMISYEGLGKATPVVPGEKAPEVAGGGPRAVPTDPKVAAAAAKAIAEAQAAQEYNRRKIQIDSDSTHYKSLLELQRNYWKSQEQAGLVGHKALIDLEKGFNEAELQDTLSAINKKKALQTSTKGLKEEEKDATLDAQALKARDDYAAKNAALDNREVDRQNKAIQAAEKFGEERIKKIKEQNDKILHELEAFAFENQEFNKKIADDEMKTRNENAQAGERAGISHAADTASSGQQGIRSAQLASERAYGLEAVHTLEQQVNHQRQLGELAAESLDIKAQELAVTAAASKADADRANAALETASTDDQVRAAADLTLKAHADDLKVTEALNEAANLRYETETKIAETLATQSVLGKLRGQFAAAGESFPSGIGNAISSGVFHQGKGGMDIGKQVTDALRNVGKNLLGDVLTAAIKQLIVSIGLNTLAQAGLQSVFKLLGIGTQVGAAAAQTTAMVTAIGVQTGAIVTGDAAILTEQTASNATMIGFLASMDAGVWALFAKPSVLGTTFDTGGPVPHDMVAMVHAGEHVLNPDQVSGIAPLPDIPAFSQLGGVTRSQGIAISHSSSTSSNVSLSGPMHFHGVQNVRQLMKEIAETAKNASPSHSPLGR